MLKTCIVLGAALALSLLSSVLLYQWGEDAREARDEANARYAAAQARLTSIQSELRTVKSNYATSNLRLDQALRGAKPTDTPRAVYNVLCERGNCAKLEPLQAPSD